MQELKKMYRIHLAKPTRDTFTNEVLPVSNGDWKTFNNPRKIKLLKKDPKCQESELILMNKEEKTLL